MRARRPLTRVTMAIGILLAGVLVVALPTSPAAANQQPSIDEEIAAADAALKTAQVKLGKTFARFNAAENRHKKAVAAVKAARATEKRARVEAAAAAKTEAASRGRFDQFASAGYREGKTVTSAEALLVSDNPGDMLKQAAMLDVLSGEYAGVLETLSTATATKAKAENDAKKALVDAALNRDKAATAKIDARKAYNAALAAQGAAKEEADQLAAQKAGLISQAGGVSASPGGDVVKPTSGTFTSGFGPRGGTIHEGLDLANSIGTPIFSAMSGTVIDAGPASGFGQWVRVQHGGGLITVYGHIATFAVSTGQTVGAGDQIATMGNEGQSTGPHLHFEVHQDGVPIDPQPWLAGFGIGV